jgi:hypothetical protein
MNTVGDIKGRSNFVFIITFIQSIFNLLLFFSSSFSEQETNIAFLHCPITSTGITDYRYRVRYCRLEEPVHVGTTNLYSI